MKQLLVLRKIEEVIRRLPIERVVIIGPQGTVSSADGIESHAELSITTKALKSSILTHNHPLGGSFSPSDIGQFLMTPFKEFRVVTAEETYILRIAPKYRKFMTLLKKKPTIENYWPNSESLNKRLWSAYRDEIIHNIDLIKKSKTQSKINKWTELVVEKWVRTCEGVVEYEVA